MTTAAQRKGDRAELELAARLTELIGTPVRRKLGAGRTDDAGDLDGVDGWCIQAKSYRDPVRAIRDGLAELDNQQANAGARYGAVMVRRPGGRWIAVLDLDRFAEVVIATRPLSEST
jgi:hypothetical protein